VSISRLLPVISLFFLALAFLVGCATTQEPAVIPKATVKPVQISKPTGKKQQQEDKDAIDPDVLFMLLTAEIAGQRGQYDVAMEGYLEAAKRVHDPRLTERAAMIAMYMRDSKRTNEAVSLWLKQDPTNLSARKIAALSALKAEKKGQAVEQLSALLKHDPAGFEKTLFELAGALQKEGNIPFINEVMEDLSLKHPDQASVYFIQSLLASDMKNKGLAERKIARALQLQPDWDKALILQAQLAVFP
jgi:predicted Zn-dependent protease